MKDNTYIYSHAGLNRLISNARVKVQLAKWIVNYRTRNRLLHMDAHQLQDIGIDWDAAQEEGRKPFWC